MTTERLVYFFGNGEAEGDPQQKDLLGGKGASLAAMTRAGLPVPPGFTISAEACRHFFENDRAWPAGLEAEVREVLARLERATGRKFGAGAHPLFVSVRSGAAVSMPGMMDTVLNCGIHASLAAAVGDTPAFRRVLFQFILQFARIVAGLGPEELGVPAGGLDEPDGAAVEGCLAAYAARTGRPFPDRPWDALVDCINAVFASWNSERAVAYRGRHDIRGLPGTAVNVQAMFPSEVSGVLFTQDPNALDANRMVVESSFGLGEVVVSGEVTPDRFLIRRDKPGDVETILGRKGKVISALGGEDTAPDIDAPSLSPSQLAELAQLGLRIESYFGAPMDIEWGWAGGRFGLLQSRPIRGLDVAREIEVGRREEIARLRALAGGKPKLWVAHNLGETLRHPTPLTWDIVRRFMAGSGGFGLMHIDLGYRPSKSVLEEGFLELIAGRVYADPDRLAQLFWEDMPMVYDLEAVRLDGGLLDSAPTRFDPDRADGGFLLRLPRTIGALLRGARIVKRARAGALDRFVNDVLPPYLKWLEAKRREDLTELSPAALIAELDARRTRVLDEFGKESLKPGFFGGVALEAVESRLEQLLGHEEGARLACVLTMGLEGDTSVEQNSMLVRVARGEVALSAFIERFGHRAAGEMELSEPRWREDPEYIERVAASLRGGSHSPEERHAENVRRRCEAEDGLPALLAKWGGSALREDIEADLRAAQALLPYRETGKHYLMMGYELIRAVILELASRWDLGRDIFFLKLDELPRFEREAEKLREEIGRRKLRRQAWRRLDLPDVIDVRDLDGLGLQHACAAASELVGEPVAAGVASGTARIVLSADAAGDLGRDYVLVCPSTDPGWTPLFINACGLVVERGGVLSHGAIVARDFGIPAVVCRDATRSLKDGDTVRVDGNRGRVQVIESRRSGGRSDTL